MRTPRTLTATTKEPGSRGARRDREAETKRAACPGHRISDVCTTEPSAHALTSATFAPLREQTSGRQGVPCGHGYERTTMRPARGAPRRLRRDLQSVGDACNVVNMTISSATSLGRVISAADANREFSRLLRGVRNGRTFVITSHGRPVARVSPIRDDACVSSAAQSALFDRLESQRVVRAGRWSRDELYRRSPL